jgi:hypothetical protein
VLTFAAAALNSENSGDAQSDAKRRHAAVAVLGIVCEGCAEGLQRRYVSALQSPFQQPNAR